MSASSSSQSVDINAIDPNQVNTFREFLQNFNRVSELCFKACIWDFTGRTVKEQEDRCTTACVEKFIKTNQRVSQRFQEIQIANNEQLMSQAGIIK